MRRRADDPPPTNSLPIPRETSSPNPIHSTPSNPNPILRVFHSIISLIQYILSLTLIPLAGFLTNTAPTDGRSLSASQASQIEFQQTYNTSASLTSTSIPFEPNSFDSLKPKSNPPGVSFDHIPHPVHSVIDVNSPRRIPHQYRPNRRAVSLSLPSVPNRIPANLQHFRIPHLNLDSL